MTLRWVHRLGYRMHDLCWLKMREIELLFGTDEEEEVTGRRGDESDSAFTF